MVLHQATGKESRWHKLFNTFRNKRKEGGGQNDSFCLKHSHNCANSRLKVGVSNMKVGVPSDINFR